MKQMIGHLIKILVVSLLFLGCAKPQSETERIRAALADVFGVVITRSDLLSEEGLLQVSGETSDLIYRAVLHRKGWEKILEEFPKESGPYRISYKAGDNKDMPDWWNATFDSSQNFYKIDAKDKQLQGEASIYCKENSVETVELHVRAIW